MGYVADSKHLQVGVVLVRFFQFNLNQFLKNVSHGHHKCMEPISNVEFSEVGWDSRNLHF